MAKIKHPGFSAEFRQLCQDATAERERADCVPKALAVLTGLPYKEVNDALIAAGRKPRRGTHWHQVLTALDALGFALEWLPREWNVNKIMTYPGAHKNLRSITTHHPQRFKKQWADEEPLLFDLKRNHVAAFKDGRVHDWSVGKALRVWRVARIVKKEPVQLEPAEIIIMEDPTRPPPAEEMRAIWQEAYAQQAERRPKSRMKENTDA